MKFNQLKNKVIAILFLIIFLIATFKLMGGVIYFSYYKPMYIPDYKSIKQIRVSNIKGMGSSIELDFRTVDWVYEVEEYRDDNFKFVPAQQNYNPHSVGYTCSILSSDGNKKFRLCHSIDYGTIGRYEVTQYEGHTVVKSAIPTRASEIIPTKDISRYVDSFHRSPAILGPTLASRPGA